MKVGNTRIAVVLTTLAIGGVVIGGCGDSSNSTDQSYDQEENA